MNVPVYIVTGFLGAGKTRFITDMLTDEGFSEGERTLLLCCEEGEEEYDSEALRKGNATLINLEDPKQIAGKRLMRLNRDMGDKREGYSEALPMTAGDGSTLQLFLRADPVNEPDSDVRWIYSIRRADQ